MSSQNYKKLRVAELRTILSERGLDDTGKKNELLERLKENDGGDDRSPMGKVLLDGTDLKDKMLVRPKEYTNQGNRSTCIEIGMQIYKMYK